MTRYCDTCEEYVETDGGQCPQCYKDLVEKKSRKKLDEWDNFDDDEYWAEDLGTEFKIKK